LRRKIRSPGCGYNDGYGAQTNGDQDRNEGPPKRYVAIHGPGGSLLIVCGLNSNKMNAEKLFNLLCLYGNVVNITEEQERLCHGADGGPPGQAESSASPNQRTVLQHQEAARLPFQLPDGTLSFKNFIGNCNNRFTNLEAASTNRIQPPA
ncbi:hypothetical protein HPB47_016672, partial [Ixodes persulcatus]